MAQLLFTGQQYRMDISIRNIKAKILYAPYYFVFLNVSLYLGFIRYLKGNQTVLWDKAVRQKNNKPLSGNKL